MSNKALIIINCNYENKTAMENVDFILNKIRTNINNDIYYATVSIPRISYFLHKIGAKELMENIPNYEEIEVIGDAAYGIKLSSLYPTSRIISFE